MPGPAVSHTAPAQPAFGAASRAALRHLKQTRPARTAPPPALDAQAADSEASNAAAMLETPQLKALEVQPASPPRQPGPRHSRSLSVSAARGTLSAHICHASVQCHSHAPPSTMVKLAKHPRRVVAHARRSSCIHMRYRCTCQQRPLHKCMCPAPALAASTRQMATYSSAKGARVGPAWRLPEHVQCRAASHRRQSAPKGQSWHAGLRVAEVSSETRSPATTVRPAPGPTAA